MLIAISREVLLAMGCTGSRIEESTPIDFDAVLGDVLGAAQRTFPTFCLPPDVFVAYLRERLPPDLPPPIALRRMHTSDPYCHLCHDQWEEMVSSGAHLKSKSSILVPAVKHACSGRFNMSRSTWR